MVLSAVDGKIGFDFASDTHRPTKIKYYYNQNFDDPTKETVICGPMPDMEFYLTAKLNIKAPSDVPIELAEAFIEPTLNKKQEQHLFRKMNYLKHKVCKLLEFINTETTTREQVAQIEHLLQQAAEVRTFLIHCNLRLAWTIAKQQAGKTDQTLFSIGELLSEAHLTLLRAVDGFDYNKNFKFSTYYVWSLRKNFWNTISDRLKLQTRWQTDKDAVLHTVHDKRHHHYDVDKADQLIKIKNVLSELLRSTSKRKRDIVSLYFGLTDGYQYSYREISRLKKISAERVRQLRMEGCKDLKQRAKELNLQLDAILS